MNNPNDRLSRCIEFLESIGLSVVISPGADGFTKGIDIKNGELHVDPAITAPSDILHEAGHVATVPGQYRHLLQRNVEGGVRKMLELIAEGGVEPDSPLFRAALQCSDPEASAWAWAAGKHLGLNDETIIRDQDFGGDGEIVRLQLRNRAYIGINGLSHAGFCATGEIQAQYNGRPVYPELKMWLQPGTLSPFV